MYGSNPVVDRVAGNRRTGQQQRTADVHVQRAARGECAGREQQRIAGQKGSDHQSRLAEDDHQQNQVRPRAVILDDDVEVFVQMQKQVDELLQQFHWQVS